MTSPRKLQFYKYRRLRLDSIYIDTTPSQRLGERRDDVVEVLDEPVRRAPRRRPAPRRSAEPDERVGRRLAAERPRRAVADHDDRWPRVVALSFAMTANLHPSRDVGSVSSKPLYSPLASHRMVRAKPRRLGTPKASRAVASIIARKPPLTTYTAVPRSASAAQFDDAAAAARVVDRAADASAGLSATSFFDGLMRSISSCNGVLELYTTVHRFSGPRRDFRAGAAVLRQDVDALFANERAVEIKNTDGVRRPI